jgi:radical SAM/Cys-rich protein
MHRAHRSIGLPMLSRGRRDRAEVARTTALVLDSRPMQAMRTSLARTGLRIEAEPIVYKDLDHDLVRLMFPVTGGLVDDGVVVSVVCLFDRPRNRTLYAHPMHAGPGVNPLVRHLDGPMASPKSQVGADGDRASQRIIEHKEALWDRFVRERVTIGQAEAGRRWREGYYWSLKRLYFCSGCTRCKWGSPFFDGPDRTLPGRAIVSRPTRCGSSLNGENGTVVEDVLRSVVWRDESRYVRRGGFTLMERPRLLRDLDDRFTQVVFPTNALLLQAGSLVGAAFMYDRRSGGVVFSHCLVAGRETEIQFLKGDVAFGLPKPQPGSAGDDARLVYRAWRRDAWSRFWLNELEGGIAVASETWLDEFWVAMEALFGGDDLAGDADRQSLSSNHDATLGASACSGRTVLPPQAIENMGGRCFVGHTTFGQAAPLRALGVTTLMVNLGKRCNQACHHCHVEAGPNRTEEMTRETVDLVLRAVRRLDCETLDITGGAPEMNPHFRYLVGEASRMGCRVVDRCNLTIFYEPGYEDLPEFLAAHSVEITASLPSDQEDVADRQRGVGSFAKSIAALRKLNELGYAKPGSGMTLNLVFNPSGDDLGEPQDALEQHYKRELFERFGIQFDRLFSMNNMPIRRFEHYLRREGRWEDYMSRLVARFNSETADGLMCRRTVSVGYDGRLYDCDFNQMMDIPLSEGGSAHIRDLDLSLLGSRVINTAGHCFGCTAGAGSSCNGALVGLTSDTLPCEPIPRDQETRRLSNVQPREANA